MPRGDGTGPLGNGPMSGWGRGNCIATFGRASRGPWAASGPRPRGQRRGARAWSRSQQPQQPFVRSQLLERIASLENRIANLAETLREQA